MIPLDITFNIGPITVSIPFMAVVLVAVVIIAALYYFLRALFNKLFRKNCYYCKHCQLSNVASCGDGSSYRCKKYNINLTPHHMVTHSEARDTMWMRCKDWERPNATDIQ